MKRVILIHPEGFYRDIIPLLQKKDIRITYMCGAPAVLEDISSTAPECIQHSIWDAMAGRPAEGIDLNKDASSYQMPLTEAQDVELMTNTMIERLTYTPLRSSQKRKVYVEYIAYWSSVLASLRPDAVIFQAAPHMGFDYVLYELCKQSGVQTLVVDRTYLPDRLYMLDAYDQPPVPPEQIYAADNRQSDTSDQEDADNYYDQYNKKHNNLGSRACVSLLSLWHKKIYRTGYYLLLLLRNLHRSLASTPSPDSIYALEKKTPSLLTHLWRRWRSDMVKETMYRDYERRTVDPQYDSPYIYFPLQLQPERTTVPMAGALWDHYSVLKMMVDALPSGWKIYLREHPRQFRKAPLKFSVARYRSFYSDLQELSDSVEFISMHESTEPLQQHCVCVATMTGTTGWEAVQTGKPALVFGQPWYLYAPGIFPVHSTQECISAIDDIQRSPSVSLGAVDAYGQWLKTEATFQGISADVFGSELSKEKNAQSYADAIAERIL